MEEKSRDYLGKYEKIVIYVLIYTVGFYSLLKTFRYTAPFIIAMIVAALLVKPVKWLCKKLKINTTLGTIIVVTLFYAVIITLVTLLIIQITTQTGNLVTNATNYINTNGKDITKFFDDKFTKFEDLFKNLRPDVKDQIKKFMDGSVDTVKTFVLNSGKGILNFVISIVTNLPYISLVVIFSLICTYYFTMQYVQKPNSFFKFLPTNDKGRERIVNILREAKSMVGKYIGSFILIISITGLISSVAYKILGVPYWLAFGLLTAFLDLLPVLGVSAVYLPMALVYLSNGNYKVPIGLAILYVVVTIGRNIWEPKIMASSLDLSPITTLIAIFVGLQLGGFIGMFFLLFLAVGYRVLVKVKVLEPFD